MCILSATLGTTLGIISAVTGVIGTVTGIVGGIQSGKAAQAEAEYQANINKQNAQIAQDNAKKERQQGLEDARRQRMKTIQAIGEQKVNIAANGAEIGTGTAIDTIEDTGKVQLTENEKQAGYKRVWLPLEKAMEIFGNYESFHTTNIADYGLYRREFHALSEAAKILKR